MHNSGIINDILSQAWQMIDSKIVNRISDWLVGPQKAALHFFSVSVLGLGAGYMIPSSFYESYGDKLVSYGVGFLSGCIFLLLIKWANTYPEGQLNNYEYKHNDEIFRKIER